MLATWILAALAVALLEAARVPLFHGLSSPWLQRNPEYVLVAIGLLTGYGLIALLPGAVCLARPAKRPKYTKALQRLVWMLPVAAGERRWFVLVSGTAGVCEELLYRGFLMRWLAGGIASGPHLPVWAALLVSSIVFSGAHLYQGRVGVVSSLIAGLFFGSLVLVTGSLPLAMLVHALVDLQVLAMYNPARDDPAAIPALLAGQ